ncbi:hypothetical protein [Nocardia sp. CA-119907]|uniref:hypothetical protein n=1 Tax=Nocardia sp. CA-119907 TaxID=3239973 RepID=UPI003D9678BF
MIKFAIKWAPFGGASTGELLATFGVDRWRFAQMIREALHPRAGDRRDVRALKRSLLDLLTWAWRMYPDSSASHPQR